MAQKKGYMRGNKLESRKGRSKIEQLDSPSGEYLEIHFDYLMTAVLVRNSEESMDFPMELPSIVH